MVDIYSFLVAHPEPNARLSVADFDADLRGWMYKAGEQINRCGGRGKKIIKYSEKNTLRICMTELLERLSCTQVLSGKKVGAVKC